jgi:hypothetical protein
MGSDAVVIGAPGFELEARVVDREEQPFVQTLIAQPAVEAFDVPVMTATSACSPSANLA